MNYQIVISSDGSTHRYVIPYKGLLENDNMWIIKVELKNLSPKLLEEMDQQCVGEASPPCTNVLSRHP